MKFTGTGGRIVTTAHSLIPLETYGEHRSPSPAPALRVAVVSPNYQTLEEHARATHMLRIDISDDGAGLSMVIFQSYYSHTFVEQLDSSKWRYITFNLIVLNDVCTRLHRSLSLAYSHRKIRRNSSREWFSFMRLNFRGGKAPVSD